MSSKEEITSALNEMEIFGSLSGLMLNRKNNTWDVGRKIKKNCKDRIEGIKWDNKPIKALGIYFDHDIDKCDELNWEGNINQMKKNY
jgi:hypothetical protein